MALSVVLYQFAGDDHAESDSPFCVKVHRALGLKKMDYTKKNVPFPKVKALNPAGKLPVADVDGERVCDSSAILAALDERQPDPPLWPSDVKARAYAHVLEDWADESLNDFAIYARWQVDAHFEPFSRRLVAKMRPPLKWLLPVVARRAALAQLKGRGLGRLAQGEVWRLLDKHLDALVGWLGDDRFLSGTTHPNAADIGVFAQLRVLTHPENAESRARVERRPTLWAWLQRTDAATNGTHTVDFQ